MATYSLAVISDLHAYVSNAKHSFIGFGRPELERRNPLLSLIQYVNQHHITADALVCAGDICNQADSGGFEKAWEALQSLKTALNANQLIATCGNHDLDSRFLVEANVDDPDPKGALLSLNTPFPFEDINLTNKFWAQNFAIVEIGVDALAVVLNTSAYHGGKEGEIEHGRVSRRTIDAIIRELGNYPGRKSHYLVCHHHLHPMRSFNTRADYQYVQKGGELLEALETHTRKTWLIIHGHRHQPRITNGPSLSACTPIIFGSSSLGAQFPGISNQFHLLHTEESTDSEHTSMVGTVKTWSWTETTGWILANQSNSGLPALCGFGFRGHISNLVSRVDTLLGENSYVVWGQATQAIPSLKYLNPEDLEHFKEALEDAQMRMLMETNGIPAQIGRKAVIS